ncbi:hypothetical protein SETIT_2G028700v2 [Setaria italica]|uniref:Uncharacterized protein n=1 Tax=Setaria italica TaxID=4555 RepID=A0A368PWS9_SETIT|nr:hypothetical protein SETIT_2G028700v2 [Setaria italica]
MESLSESLSFFHRKSLERPVEILLGGRGEGEEAVLPKGPSEVVVAAGAGRLLYGLYALSHGTDVQILRLFGSAVASWRFLPVISFLLATSIRARIGMAMASKRRWHNATSAARHGSSERRCVPASWAPGSTSQAMLWAGEDHWDGHHAVTNPTPRATTASTLLASADGRSGGCVLESCSVPEAATTKAPTPSRCTPTPCRLLHEDDLCLGAFEVGTRALVELLCLSHWRACRAAATARARAAAAIASLSSSGPHSPSERVSARGVAPASELPRRRDEGQVEEEADEAAQEEAPKDEAEIQVDRFASSVLGILQFGCTLLINSSFP